jgi:hypothetical protein
MQFILNWPPAISFVVVSVITTLIALAGLRFVRKKYPAEVLKENHEVAAIIFNAFGLLYGVVVAFVVFVTWSGYDEATKNLQMEANETIDIFHIAKAYPEPVRTTIRQGLMEYANSVYNDELKRMSEGQISLYSRSTLRNLINLFNNMDQSSAPNRELYAESLSCISKLAEYRRLRVFYDPGSYLAGLADRWADHSLLHVLPRCEEHQGAVPHDSCADNNHNVNFGFDLYS